MLIFSLEGVKPEQEKIFNRLALKEFSKIRDFLVLHYNATTRDDSEFWNYCRTMDVPDSLTEKIELFRLNGQFFREEDELFTAHQLGCGNAWAGHSTKLVTAHLSTRLTRKAWSKKWVKWKNPSSTSCIHMPTHAEFLQKYCPANAPA